MKYDLNKQMTKTAHRTLVSFVTALFELLKVGSFENISVNRLCEKAGYPRATFYNYFDDKYDLLEYFWHYLSFEMILADTPKGSLDHKEAIKIVFGKFYDFSASYEDSIYKVLEYNNGENYFMNSLSMNIRSCIRKVYDYQDKGIEHTDLPKDLLIDHFTDAVVLVLSHRFIKGKKWDKAIAFHYLEELADI